jgi:hypothetical protein
LLLRFLGDFGSIEENKGKVLSIDVPHLDEVIHHLTDIRLAPPDEQHAVVEQAARQGQLFLN